MFVNCRGVQCTSTFSGIFDEILDNLHQAKTKMLTLPSKLKSKLRGPSTLFFHHDCYRFLFQGKGRANKDGKSTMLEKQDFDQCNFDNLWDQCLDKNGDGVRIKFPIKLQLNLSWSPKITAVKNGTLVNPPRMPLEKLTIEFIRQPFSILIA